MTNPDELATEVLRLRDRGHKTAEDLQRAIVQLETLRGSLGIVEEKVRGVAVDLEGVNRELDKLDSKYVTRIEHAPVERLTYGAVATILALVLTGLLALLFGGRG